MAKSRNTKKASANTKTSSKKSSKKTRIKSISPSDDRMYKSFGLGLILLSIYLFIAFSSYAVTWKIDQDKVEGVSFFSFLFNSPEISVQNWLGKLGALTSHRLMHNGFGIGSFAIPFILFITGLKLGFRKNIVPYVKTAKVALVTMVWISITMAFLASMNYMFLGGKFGFHITSWLQSSLGNVGAFFFIVFSFLISTVLLFNPSFALFDQLFGESEERVSKTKIEEIAEPAKNEYLKVETTEEVEVLVPTNQGTVDLSTDNDTPVKPAEHVVIDMDDEFEVLDTKAQTAPKHDPKKPVEVEVFQKTEEEVLTEKQINSKLEEFGEFDPTLELSSYKLPSPEMLANHDSNNIPLDKDELQANKNKIIETLSHYNIKISKIKATIGPTVTLYEIVPAPGVKIKTIKNLEDDIALSLAALGIRIIAPIPGKGTIGIEVPNSNPEIVSMKTVIKSDKFQNTDYELPVALGKTIANETFVADLAKMPHLLMAGATGQGKSVGLNAILVSILYKKHPSQVKFVLVDPKKVELTLFNKIERHFLAKLPDEEEPIITDTSKVVTTLNSLCIEMDTRYELLKNAQVRNIKEYNKKFISRRLNPEEGHQFLPYIVLVVDEFADLIMTAGREVETPIARLAQLARAIGIHLIIATQRPSVKIITGTIKANFPSRIAFRVTSLVDSRTILDSKGADQLIGRGDMLYSAGSDIVRLQCAFVDTPEVEEICDFIGNQRAYPSALLLPEYIDENAGASKEIAEVDRDSMFEDAARIIVMHQQGSASLLQRKLKLGYNRAGRIVDQLEAAGIIGPFEGSKARKVLVPDEYTLEQMLSPKEPSSEAPF